ncbi:MAG: hypothetical protein ACTSR8_06235 [Promethearchaeota archaeon]
MIKKNISLLIIGIIFISTSPFIAMLLDKVVIEDQKGALVSKVSENRIDYAYHKPFTLEKGQKAIIEFSLNFKNSTLVFFIAGRAEYRGLDKSETAPSEISTKYSFLQTEFSKWEEDKADLVNNVNEITLTNDGFAYIEFMGDVSGDNDLISMPGDYIIIIYTTNHPNGYNEVEFNIKVSIDGPYDAGDIMGMSLLIVGFILVAYVAIISFKLLIDKWREN